MLKCYPLNAGIAIAMLIACAPAIATAQSVSNDLSNGAQSNFSRDRDVSVSDRPHPLYQPLGVHVGAFTLYPSIDAGLVFDDNIYAQPHGQVSDIATHVRPGVRLDSNWSRGYLSLTANGTFNRYLTHSGEDTDDWNLAANGGTNFSLNGKVDASASSSRLTEPRSAPSSVSGQAAPVQYYLNAANVSASQERNRWKLTVNTAVQRFDYDNAPAVGGGFINETFRDRTVTTESGRVDYAISPALALFGQVTGNIRNYDNPDPSTLKTQNANGFEILAGTSFEVTHVVRGQLGVGYLNETYTNSAYGKVSGLGFRNKIEWFPSQLTTVTGTLSRSVEDSGSAGAPNFKLTQGGVQVDHELMRNVILTAQTTYGESVYIGIPRTDDRFQYGGAVTYLFNRHVGLSLNFNRLQQRSYHAAAGTSFDDDKVGLSLALRL